MLFRSIADMSDMVQKMNGMSAFTKNWAEKLATSMFSATPEQKQFSFVTDLRQAEINSRNEREQRERDMAVLKQRLEEEHAARVSRNIEEAARHEIEVETRIAAERDNLYNLQQQKQRELVQQLAADEIQSRDNLYNQEESRRVTSAAFQLAIQRRANEEIFAEMLQQDIEEKLLRDNAWNDEQRRITERNLMIQRLTSEQIEKEERDREEAFWRSRRLAKLAIDANLAVTGGNPYEQGRQEREDRKREDRKSTRLNSSH